LSTELVSGSPRRRPAYSRRTVLRAGFWGAIAALFASAIASVTNALFPRNVSPFGGPITVPASAIPEPGAPPKQIIEGRFWLVNLRPDEGKIAGDDAATPGGLLALYRKCPHLGCTVPWRAEARLAADPAKRTGWFLCPCHQSTYTRAGVRVFGPAPRSMDTMKIEVLESGNIVVQTGQRTEGGTDNPRRAVPWPPATTDGTLS